MKKVNHQSGFALALTLVLMALLVIVVVAYLASTRIERSTSSVYANRLRAKISADSGLAAAIHLLRDNTRYGNYITAMPPTAPAPVPRRTELYRPGVSAADLSANPNDYLRLDNAVGEILSSRATAGTSPLPPVDARPPPNSIPGAGPFVVSDPGFTATNSYDFNQIIRLGTSSAGRLVNSDVQPAFGQWVRVRNSGGDLIGRYAFFIEDESMKVNVNVAGNNTGGSNLRINDLTLPATAPAPATQIQEIDPAAILPTAANRPSADTTLAGVGNAGSRLISRSTLAILNEWGSASNSFPDYAHLATVLSREDDTTARGWQRLDLNALVAGAADKVAVATRMANWIRDAWTGPGSLPPSTQEYQIFGNQRLRLQLAANIVDYIDADNVPTDMGDVLPDGYTDTAYKIPVIGIEKIPYLGSIFIIYEASGRVGNTATMRMKMRFNFVNLYESPLDLQSFVSSIEVTGVPTVSKKGAIVFDVSTQPYPIPIASLTAVTGSGYVVPAGVDGPSGATSGARSFETGWLVPGATVTFSTLFGLPTFGTEQVTVRVLGAGGARLDVTAAASTDTPSTGYKPTSSPSGDFLLDSDTAARTVAAIFLQERVIPTTTVTQNFGDPRYRSTLLNERWRRLNSTDITAIDSRVDIVDANPRIYGVDWFDYVGNRPLAFLRNGPILNIGELGNVSFAEYPWRTGFLQYPERPATAGNAVAASEVTTRRSDALDYVLIDLFRAQSAQPRVGAININTQQRFGTTQQHAFAPLLYQLPFGTQTLTQTPIDMVGRISTATASAAVSPIFDRRIAVGPPPDNNPVRPFFQIGELASVLSRLINSSDNTTTGSPARTTVTYSALRTSPTTKTQINANYRSDMGAEQAFREVSNSITTRGNIFRVLYVGQAIKDSNKDGSVSASQEIVSEYLGEAFVERQPKFALEGTAPDSHMKTSDSTYKILANRVVTE